MGSWVHLANYVKYIPRRFLRLQIITALVFKAPVHHSCRKCRFGWKFMQTWRSDLHLAGLLDTYCSATKATRVPADWRSLRAWEHGWRSYEGRRSWEILYAGLWNHMTWSIIYKNSMTQEYIAFSSPYPSIPWLQVKQDSGPWERKSCRHCYAHKAILDNINVHTILVHWVILPGQMSLEMLYIHILRATLDTPRYANPWG